MSKQIQITGKKNIDKFKKRKTKREIIKKWCIDDCEYNHENQVAHIQKLMNLGEILDEGRVHTEEYNGTIYKIIRSEIKSKLNGYKQQDIEKYLIDKDKFITYDKTLELLSKSNLICYYCQKQQYILYKTVRQMNQWSLDRIDNTKGHNYDNVVISCLGCNLQRKRQDDEKFKFTKQMKLIKVDCSNEEV